MDKFTSLGCHFICDLSGCDEQILFDNERIKRAFRYAVDAVGLTIMDEGRIDFDPCGFTYYLLLQESHASIHVWPEYRYCAADLYSCNLSTNMNEFFGRLQTAFHPDYSATALVNRGYVRGDQLAESRISISHASAQLSKAVWGWHLALNLYDCDAQAIHSATVIADFAKNLCDLIQMKRYGDPHVVLFGEKPEVYGYSLFQLIETSNISGHFVDADRSAYLDIFSCKEFDPYVAANFCAEVFGAKVGKGVFIYRG